MALIQRIVEEFIEIYRLQPCLWKIKSKEYRDRPKREAAYTKLIEKLKELEPDANKDAVVKKINNLRSNVRKERKKYENSLKSGASTDDVYQPKLWYYKLMGFLNEQETPRESTSNLDTQDENISEINSSQLNQHSPVTNDPDLSFQQESSKRSNQSISSIEPIEDVQSNNVTYRSRSGERKEIDESLINDVLMTVRDHFKRPCIPEDRYDIMGKAVAVKLRGLDNKQRLIAEKIINDVLFEAEIGNLTFDHKFINMQQYQQTTSF